MPEKKNLIIRKIAESELSFLDDMLYEAIFIPAGEEKLPGEIIKHPDLSQYTDHFGSRNGDICFTALVRDRLIGAVWTRLFRADSKGYGFVDSQTPELSMAVCREFRGRGIGKLLLRRIADELKKQGFRQVSLSVDKRNFAFGFYQKSGFDIVKSKDTSAVMVKRLAD